MSEHDDLRDLFREATDDVRPRGTYDDIRSRIEEDPVARRWFLPAIAAAAVVAVVIGGAVWITRDDGGSTARPAAPSPTADATTGTVETDVTAYYVGESAGRPKVFGETRSVASDGGDMPLLALREAAGVPASDPDYVSYWPKDVRIESVSFDGVGDDGVIQVEVGATGVDDRPAGVTPAQARAQVAALVRTAQTAFDAKAPVEFVLAGSRLTDVLGVAGPQFTAGTDDEVMAPVQVTSLLNGQTVPTGDLEVEGVAAAFEANVQWELLVGGDAVVQSGFATAAECCTLSPYSFTVKDLQPGKYTLVVHDSDESGEGRPTHQDSKEIVVE